MIFIISVLCGCCFVLAVNDIEWCIRMLCYAYDLVWMMYLYYVVYFIMDCFVFFEFIVCLLCHSEFKLLIISF